MKNFNIVATPIGNLKEITQRAIEAFNESEIFFCEDTRVTKKLLELLNIDYYSKKFITNNLQTENNINLSKEIIENNNCCLVSDAGYPLVSDPGYNLVRRIREFNTNINIINGPSSVIHALIASGIKMNNFYFAGFLSVKETEKTKTLMDLKNINSTIVIFEGVKKLKSTLEVISNIFKENNISVCKELTKMNEKVYHGKAKDLIDSIDYKGEFVIVIDNNDIKNNSIDDECLISEMERLISKGTDKKTASKMVGYKYDLKSNYLYDLLIKR